LPESTPVAAWRGAAKAPPDPEFGAVEHFGDGMRLAGQQSDAEEHDQKPRAGRGHEYDSEQNSAESDEQIDPSLAAATEIRMGPTGLVQVLKALARLLLLQPLPSRFSSIREETHGGLFVCGGGSGGVIILTTSAAVGGRFRVVMKSSKVAHAAALTAFALAACDVHTTTPGGSTTTVVNPGTKTEEKNTTVVTPSGEKKTETKSTTVTSPSGSATETTTTTTKQ
jgi:hypothetical protein